MIDRNHDLPITRQAKRLNISRGSVYSLPKPVSEADLALMRRLDELHLKHPFMGARMLRDQLALAGIQAGTPHRHTDASHGYRSTGTTARHQQGCSRSDR